MSDIVIGFSGLGISLLLIAMRVHIGVALGSVSLLGIGVILNSQKEINVTRLMTNVTIDVFLVLSIVRNLMQTCENH